MRFLLINPWIYDFIAYDFWQKPLGLLYIADFLKRSGHDVYFMDLLNRADEGMPRTKTREDGTGKYYYEIVEKPENLKNIPFYFKRFGLPYTTVKSRLEIVFKDFRPDYVLMSIAITYWYYGARELIKLIKKIAPSVPVIIGGIFSTLYGPEAKELVGADISIAGDGVKGLEKFINFRLKGDEHWLNVLDPGYYFYKHIDYLTLITSVGCPFVCKYCAANVLQPDVFQIRPDKVVEIIEKYSKLLGTNNIAFFDDALLFRYKKHFLKVADLIEERLANKRYYLPNGINIRYFTEEVAARLRDFDFKEIRFGLETLVPERQGEIGEKLSNSEFERTVDLVYKYGLEKEVSFYVLIGLTNQTKDEIEYTIRKVKETSLRVRLTEYSPIPMTLEWERQLKNKLIKPDMDPLWANSFLLYFRDPRYNLTYKNQLLQLIRS